MQIKPCDAYTSTDRLCSSSSCITFLPHGVILEVFPARLQSTAMRILAKGDRSGSCESPSNAALIGCNCQGMGADAQLSVGGSVTADRLQAALKQCHTKWEVPCGDVRPSSAAG